MESEMPDAEVPGRNNKNSLYTRQPYWNEKPGTEYAGMKIMFSSNFVLDVVVISKEFNAIMMHPMTFESFCEMVAQICKNIEKSDQWNVK